MNKIRVGVVGLGRLGFTHAENITTTKNASLVAVCSHSEEELKKAKEKLGVTNYFTDIIKMVETIDLDAVILVSPSNFHSEQSIYCLQKGLHVFCEKPLATTIDACKEVERIVAENPSKVFMLGFMRRYDPSYLYAKKCIDEGKIGRPILFRGYSVDPNSAIEGALKYAAHSPGQFIDMAVHDFDLARWFLKAEATSIYAIGGCYLHQEYKQYDDGDNVSALLKFENEAMAFIFAGRTAAHGYNVETEIVGTHATLRIGSVPQKNLVEILDEDGVRKECSQSFNERFEVAFKNEIQEFIACIVEERHPEISAHDGTQASYIAEMATESFKNNILINL
jgi:myo-inositol 2-dehydrogenase/D-chiro-inositol 1-dehydrogenase